LHRLQAVAQIQHLAGLGAVAGFPEQVFGPVQVAAGEVQARKIGAMA
jgi:hypothetical protein